MRMLPQRLRDPVRRFHEACHHLGATLMDELLHPLNSHLVILTQPQLLLRTMANAP